MGKEINLNSSEWRDIVFEGKNHKYGAYYLRGSSSNRHIIAFFVVLVFVAVVAISSFLAVARPEKTNIEGNKDKYAMVDIEEPEEPEAPVDIPPDAPPPPPPLAEAAQFTPPVIKKDNEVDESKVQKTNEELVENKDELISNMNVTKEEATKGGKDPRQALTEQSEVTAKAPTIFTSVEQMPQFPGGPTALLKFVANGIKYPTIAAENGIEGRVVVRFVVTKDGSISDVTVLKKLDPSCDKEAIRVVKTMPKWIPGMQNGIAVPVYFTLPVVFKLQK